MSLLFETIRLQDGVLQNLEYHNSRMNESRKALYNSTDFIDLASIIKIPAAHTPGIYKCKVVYGILVEHISFEKYIPRKIQSLRFLVSDTIQYSYKYSDRQQLNDLLSAKGDFDDILIIKNGLITDTSFSNILFYDGSRWITPSTPLLKGTMRSFLLKNKQIEEKEISPSDLTHFSKARLLNAMLPFEPGFDIEIGKISF